MAVPGNKGPGHYSSWFIKCKWYPTRIFDVLNVILKLVNDWGGVECVRNQHHLSVVVSNCYQFNKMFYFQDYSKFMDEDFDVKEWVNGAFNSQKEGNKDVSNY